MNYNKDFIGPECPNCKCVSFHAWTYEKFTKLLCKECMIVSKKWPDYDGKKQHPTQKPIKLYEYCLKKYAEKGNKILDTHLGSGSIAIACDKNGFDLVACEYYNNALKRLKIHQQQLTMF